MTTLSGWSMTEPNKPFEKRTWESGPLAASDLLVEVAGCGLCHTDISFHRLGVPTRKKPPLVLGHEISGRVLEIGAEVPKALLGQPVLIPAVLPCGKCPSCLSDQRRICQNQIMPGNDQDGGFASHVVVPAKFVCPVPKRVLEKHELWELSIVSDAVTTPYQALKLSGIQEGQLALCVGVGGIGIHGVQAAKAFGAKVLALDVDVRKLEVAKRAGADAVLDVSKLSFKELRGQVQEAVKELGAPKVGWKIFEMSGTKAGQETAFGLLNFGASLHVVGYTSQKVEVRLSNLMAYDARLIGNWGCDPLLYQEVLELLEAGKLLVSPYVEKHSLADINLVFEIAHLGKLEKRAVLVP